VFPRRASTAFALLGTAALAWACASAESDDDGAAIDARSIPDAPSTRADAPVNVPDATPVIDAEPPDARPPDAAVASMCPTDQFATGFDSAGMVQCATIDEAAKTSFEKDCFLYAAWRDSCDGCTTVPTKWGRAGGSECVLGTGADDTCTTPSLGGVSVAMLGINTDGDVNDDDKFYVGFQCTTPADTPVAGPCPTGSFLSSVGVDGEECVTARGAIAEYLRTSCTLYYGWRDSCDGCTTAPSKWGRVSSTACNNGTGTNNSCTVPTLGAQGVRLFGLNTDGDVNDDDKFYLGLQCTGATTATQTVADTCPAGQLVVGRDSAGQILCASPVPAAEVVVQNGCYLYQGYRDNCGGCSDAPSKWGRTSQNACNNGTGAANTCTIPSLGGTSVRMFGINTDGDVDDNDKFYFGTRCP
jgi:hypothetical protein